MPTKTSEVGSAERLYHLISVHPQHGRKIRLTGYPMTHAECMTMKSKFTPHKFSTLTVEEA